MVMEEMMAKEKKNTASKEVITSIKQDVIDNLVNLLESNVFVDERINQLCEDTGRTKKVIEQEYLKQLNKVKQNFASIQQKRSKEIAVPDQHLTILQNKKLLDLLVKEVSKKVEGEEDTIRCILTFRGMGYVLNSTPVSSNLFLSDRSGVGKDYVTKNTLSLWDKSLRVHSPKTSPQVLAYLHNEPEWSWDTKSLYLEEISQSTLESETFLAFVSNRDFRGHIAMDGKAIELKINGKPVIFITSASKNIKHDTIRRLPACQLDESNDQTTSIVSKQWMDENVDYDPEITKALGYLQAVNVNIPYKTSLGALMLSSYTLGVLLRTTNKRLIDLIKGSASLHQFSREKEGENILANYDDYLNGVSAFKKITRSATTMSLTKNKEKLLALLSADELKTVAEIEHKVTFCSKPKLYDLLRNMANEELIVSDKKEVVDKMNRTYRTLAYKKIDINMLNFPTVDSIKELEKKLYSIYNVKNINSIKNINNIKSINKTTVQRLIEQKRITPVLLMELMDLMVSGASEHTHKNEETVNQEEIIKKLLPKPKTSSDKQIFLEGLVEHKLASNETEAKELLAKYIKEGTCNLYEPTPTTIGRFEK